jgi:hypothetical protein
LILSEWKKLEESTCRVILMACPSLENLGFETFYRCFEASNDIFGGQNFLSLNKDLSNNTKIIRVSSCFPEYSILVRFICGGKYLPQLP